MTAPSVEQIQKTLTTVQEVETKKDLVSLNMVKRVDIQDGDVTLVIELPRPAYEPKQDLEDRVVKAVKTLSGIKSVSILYTAKPVVSDMAPPPAVPLPGVKNIIAVYACKGGVGKSTLSTNLAVALAHLGHKVGLLDADIHGPNVPLMMGLKGRPVVDADNRITPMMGHKVKTMSLGVLTDPSVPMIWRGPMVHGAIKQLLRDTVWGELDYLIVDLPPGTGDAQLSVTQTVPLAGVIFVTTPQTVSLIDGIKGINMFKKLNIPIVGLVENMSGFTCPHCGKETDIFSKGGGVEEAKKRDLRFLGAVPLDPSIVISGDSGLPIVTSHPDSAAAKALVKIAEQVSAHVP